MNTEGCGAPKFYVARFQCQFPPQFQFIIDYVSRSLSLIFQINVKYLTRIIQGPVSRLYDGEHPESKTQGVNY